MTREQFNELPKDVQDEAKDTLKAYDKVYITYEYGEYKVSVGIALTATYASDHRTIGTVSKEDIYTKEEMMLNYIESFHEYPPQYTGKRDYQMLKNIGYNWETKFKFNNDGDIVVA